MGEKNIKVIFERKKERKINICKNSIINAMVQLLIEMKKLKNINNKYYYKELN